MHAYRDAIRRTQGAYVVYTGPTGGDKRMQGFHEVLPGLGAFALRPGSGTSALTAFLQEVVAHVADRSSTREQQSFHTYKTYEQPFPDAVEEQRALMKWCLRDPQTAKRGIRRCARPLWWWAGSSLMRILIGLKKAASTTFAWAVRPARCVCLHRWWVPAICCCMGMMAKPYRACSASKTLLLGHRCIRLMTWKILDTRLSLPGRPIGL